MDNQKECVCEICGKTFTRGSEGDNERMHLRCERVSLRNEHDDEVIEIMDRAYPASDDFWEEGY